MKMCNFYKISKRTTTTSQKIQNKFALFDHQCEYFCSLIFIAKFCAFAGFNRRQLPSSSSPVKRFIYVTCMIVR